MIDLHQNEDHKQVDMVVNRPAQNVCKQCPSIRQPQDQEKHPPSQIKPIQNNVRVQNKSFSLYKSIFLKQRTYLYSNCFDFFSMISSMQSILLSMDEQIYTLQTSNQQCESQNSSMKNQIQQLKEQSRKKSQLQLEYSAKIVLLQSQNKSLNQQLNQANENYQNLLRNLQNESSKIKSLQESSISKNWSNCSEQELRLIMQDQAKQIYDLTLQLEKKNLESSYYKERRDEYFVRLGQLEKKNQILNTKCQQLEAWQATVEKIYKISPEKSFNRNMNANSGNFLKGKSFNN